MYMLITFLTGCDLADSIIGGYNIKIHEAPYHLSYGDVCGAVLIHKKWALTTAHCGTNMTFIRIGSSQRFEGFAISVSGHIIHPLYQNEHEFDYDVQLLELKRGLKFSKSVKAADIGVRSGDSVYVSGWGYTEEKGEYHDSLQQVKVHIVPMDTCQEQKQSWYNHTLTDRMFCAGGEGHDACQGDSGGGAVSLNGKLVGLSSFGFGCDRGVPGVYVNLSNSKIRNWIRHHTGV